MKMYKGFDKNLQCLGFQYEVGKKYETETAKLCSAGFHACENPLDVFNYYDPTNRFCEVDLDATDEVNAEDSKRCGKYIKVVAEIGLSGLVKAGVKFILDRVDFGDSAAMNTGDYSAAMNTGNYSAATNTGNYSVATNTGNRSAAEVTGTDSIAIVTGHKCKAKGSLNCWLVLTERDDDYHIINIKAIKVDGEKIKPDTFYSLENGEVVIAE